MALIDKMGGALRRNFIISVFHLAEAEDHLGKDDPKLAISSRKLRQEMSKKLGLDSSGAHGCALKHMVISYINLKEGAEKLYQQGMITDEDYEDFGEFMEGCGHLVDACLNRMGEESAKERAESEG